MDQNLDQEAEDEDDPLAEIAKSHIESLEAKKSYEDVIAKKRGMPRLAEAIIKP